MRGLRVTVALFLLLVLPATGLGQTTSATAPVRDYIEELYWVVLGGAPSAEELEWGVELAYTHGEVKTLTALLLVSPEFLEGRGSDPEQFVGVLFRLALDREPDLEEVARNVERLTSGAGARFDLVMEFLGSPNFAEKDPLR